MGRRSPSQAVDERGRYKRSRSSFFWTFYFTKCNMCDIEIYSMQKGRDAYDTFMEKELDHRLDRQLLDGRLDEPRLAVPALIYRRARRDQP